MRPLSTLFGSIALAAVTTACASTGSVPRPFPGAPTLSHTPDRTAVVETALDLRGAPYRNGGADPRGFDCSGFTQYVFAQHGVSLPRSVRDQFHAGELVSATELVPGDLLFFTTTDPGASHVAIALNADEFVHAPSSTGVVRVEHLSARYWRSRFIAARRITQP